MKQNLSPLLRTTRKLFFTFLILLLVGSFSHSFAQTLQVPTFKIDASTFKTFLKKAKGKRSKLVIVPNIDGSQAFPSSIKSLRLFTLKKGWPHIKSKMQYNEIEILSTQKMPDSSFFLLPEFTVANAEFPLNEYLEKIDSVLKINSHAEITIVPVIRKRDKDNKYYLWYDILPFDVNKTPTQPNPSPPSSPRDYNKQ